MSSTRHALLFPGAAATALAALIAAAVPAQAAPVTISKGHVDVVDIGYADGSLELVLHDETVDPPVERDPADVLLEVLPGAETTVPSGSAYSFLGDSGDLVWILPQEQNPDLLYAGWAGHDLPTGVLTNDTVQLSLVGVAGPADVSLFDITSTGSPDIKFDSGNGLPDAVPVEANAHHHTNWAFEAEGDYTLTFQATGTLNDGTPVNSPEVSYHFTVD